VPTVKKLADEELARQQKLGAQSCRGLLGSPDLGILGGDRHAKRVFDEVLAREKEMSGAWAVFYHSYNTPAWDASAYFDETLCKDPRRGSSREDIPDLVRQ